MKRTTVIGGRAFVASRATRVFGIAYFGLATGELLLFPLLVQAAEPRCQVTVRKADQDAASPVAFAAGVCDTNRERLMIVGGIDSTNRDGRRPLLACDLRTGRWSNVDVGDRAPQAAVKPALAYDAKRDALYLFGGWARGASDPSDQLWTLPLAGDGANAWQFVAAQQPQPPARNGCAMALDMRGDRLLVHGGDGGLHPTNGFTPLDDLWSYDLSAKHWSRLKATGPAPEARWNHTAALDQQTRRLYVYGGVGYVGERLVRDTCVFELDLDKLVWTRHYGGPQAPPPLMGTTLTHDPVADVLLLVGGLSVADDGPPGPTSVWLFDLKSKMWVEHRNVLGSTRRDHTAVYDPARRLHVIHGGETARELGNYYAPGEPLRDTLLISITARQ